MQTQVTATAVISTKGQVVIPAEVRSALGLQEGDRLTFVIDDGRLVVERLPTRAERRKKWMAEAFAEYAKSDVEKVWASIDGEDFVDG
jgi:AbrB family looped-hinge helix DNA binding protein